MLHIPILRCGRPYESIDQVELRHHATGETVAAVSQANSGMVRRDILRMNDRALEALAVADLVSICGKAADLFVGAEVPLGDQSQSFDDYLRQLSATTGMPLSYCRNNAGKIHKVLSEMDAVIGGLTRHFDLSILDRGFGTHNGGTLSFHRAGRIFGAVLPSNSPGVHSLWIPALAMKAPAVLKPGREEPWTPYRIIQSFLGAGLPAEAFGFYPTDHTGAGELLRTVDRAMLFGDTATTQPYRGDGRVEVHGPGYSKVLLGEDAADDFERYLDVIVESVAANGGRSCINASAVWTPRNGTAIAEAVAARLAPVEALPADDPGATIAAFGRPEVAEYFSAAIDRGLAGGGAEDVAQRLRGSGRLVRRGRCAYLLPTIVRCDHRDHELANREFLFPYASVVECPADEMPGAVGPTLVATLITRDRSLIERAMAAGHVDRLNVGPIPTVRLIWDQPHEGNLFELLYRQRAFQIEPAA